MCALFVCIMQNYHEELRRCMPRRRMLSDYARQLMRRYPNMKEDISLRLQRLHTYWETLEKTLSPQSFLDNNTKIVQGMANFKHCFKYLSTVSISKHWLKCLSIVSNIRALFWVPQALFDALFQVVEYCFKYLSIAEVLEHCLKYSSTVLST